MPATDARSTKVVYDPRSRWHGTIGWFLNIARCKRRALRALRSYPVLRTTARPYDHSSPHASSADSRLAVPAQPQAGARVRDLQAVGAVHARSRCGAADAVAAGVP